VLIAAENAEHRKNTLRIQINGADFAHQTGSVNARRKKVLFFADVFIPHGWISANIVCKQRDALLRVEIDHLHSQGTQPSRSHLKVPTLPNYHGSKPNWRTKPLQYQQVRASSP